MVYEIDLSQVYSADELHGLLEEILPLPDYYGKNLDALHDVLTEGHKEGWEIHFHNTADAKAILGKYMNSLQKMCSHAQKENEKLTITFD